MRQALLLLILLTPLAHARMVTLLVTGTNQTDSVEVKPFESFRIVSGRDALGYIPNAPFSLEVYSSTRLVRVHSADLFGVNPRDGNLFPANPVIMSGPATVTLLSGAAARGDQAAFVTLEILPDALPPDKTIIIPEGTGARVALECSTNLTQWTELYSITETNSPTHKFFRIKAERLP